MFQNTRMSLVLAIGRSATQIPQPSRHIQCDWRSPSRDDNTSCTSGVVIRLELSDRDWVDARGWSLCLAHALGGLDVFRQGVSWEWIDTQLLDSAIDDRLATSAWLGTVPIDTDLTF